MRILLFKKFVREEGGTGVKVDMGGSRRSRSGRGVRTETGFN